MAANERELKHRDLFLPSKVQFRFSLRAALVLLAIAPLLLAMMYRRELHVERYEYVSSAHGKFSHESMWKRRVWESKWHLEYLLVYLPLDRPGIAKPGGVATSDVLATPVSRGISRIPSGLYFNGKRINTEASGRCSVYDPVRDEILELKCDYGALDALTFEQVKQRQDEEFWAKNLIPILKGLNQH